MKTLSFPTIKLGEHIKQIKLKVKDTELDQANLTVYGVTNTEGVSITNNKASDDLGNYIVLNEHQFAYNPYRINVGSVGLSPKGTFGIVSPAYVVFETDEHINSEFLLYYLKSSIGINLIKWYGDRGGVRAALRYSDLEKIDFPNISLEKQLYILAKIKKLESKTELIIGKTGIGDIEKLRQSILQQAVEGKLCEQTPDDEPASVLLEKIKKEKDKLIKEGKIKKQKDLLPVSDEKKTFEIPNGWERCRLGEITEILRGSSPRPKGSPLYWSGVKNENHWITISDITAFCKNNYLKDTSEYLTQKGTQYSTYVSENDLIIAVSGSTTGKSCLTGINGYIYDGLACIRTIGNCVEHSYLYYYMQHMYQKLNDSKIGSAFPNINTEVLKNMIFSLPPLQEQRRIVEKVDELMILCDKLENEVNKAQQYAAQLMESVLQEAFANDEQVTEEQPKYKGKVIPIRPEQKAELHFAIAARGNIKQSTLESLQKRAIEISNGEK